MYLNICYFQHIKLTLDIKSKVKIIDSFRLESLKFRNNIPIAIAKLINQINLKYFLPDFISSFVILLNKYPKGIDNINNKNANINFITYLKERHLKALL